MSALAGKFPVYQLRLFGSIIYDGSLVLLQTYYSVYILDDTSLEGDYFKRRLYIALHEDNYDFKLYPLRIRCTNVSQVLSVVRKGKYFIDNTGKLFKFKPHKYFKLITYEVVHICEKLHNKYLLTVKIDAFTHINIISDRASDYVQLVKLGPRSFILYDNVDKMLKDTIRKI